MNRAQLTADSEAFVRGLPDWAQHLPVFERARQGLMACAEDLDLDDFALRPDSVDRFRGRIENERSANADWARIFIALWYCSNFSRLRWIPLIRADVGNIRHAIEECYFVLAVSGADGTPDLKRLVREFDCLAEAKSHLEKTRFQEPWQKKWIERVLAP